MLGALLFGFHLLGLGSLQFGKPHRGRGVAQENHQADGSGESDRRRNPETPFPCPDMRRGGHHALHTRGIVGRNAQVGGDGSHGVGIARHVRPQRPHDVTAENHHEARADRVRGIPHRHLRRQLRRRNPMGQQTRAGRESRTLQQAVDDPHDAHEEDHRVAELVARMLARDPVGRRPRRIRTRSWPVRTAPGRWPCTSGRSCGRPECRWRNARSRRSGRSG